MKVGLTGGIACGKSFVLREFERLGAHVIDADQIARRVVEPGQPALQAIVEAFGPRILTRQGTLDRQRLGRLVFSDARLRERLNRLIHPHILAEETRLMAELERNPQPGRSPMVVVDAALMIEVGSYRRYDVVLVVYCPPALQLQRLMERDGLTEQEARRRINSQMPVLEKVRYADYVIDNSGSLAQTREQIRQVFQELLRRWGEAQD